MPTTSLRLLLDECVDRRLKDEIEALGRSLRVESVGELPFANRGFSDEDVVRYATENNRIVVTTESRFNERQFPICTHPGIIVIKAIAHHSSWKSRMFKDLSQSGMRRRCNHAVTYLRLSETGNRTIATFKERDTSSGSILCCVVDLSNGRVLSEWQ